MGVPQGAPGRAVRCYNCQEISRIPDPLPGANPAASRGIRRSAVGIAGILLTVGIGFGPSFFVTGDGTPTRVTVPKPGPVDQTPPLPDQPLKVTLPARGGTAGRAIAELSNFHPDGSPLAFSPDGRTLLGIDSAGQISAWNFESGTAVKPLAGPTWQADCFAVSDDGGRLAVAGRESSAEPSAFLQLRDLPSFRELRGRVPGGRRADAVAVDFSPDGGRVLIVQVVPDGPATLRIIDTATGLELASAGPPEFRFRHVARFAGGRSVLVECLPDPDNPESAPLAIWHPGTSRAEPIYRLKAGLRGMALSPDRRRVALASGNEVHVIDLPSRRLGWVFVLPARAQGVLGFSPGGGHLFAAGRAEGQSRLSLHLLDLTTGGEAGRILIPGDTLRGAAIRPGSRELVTSGPRGTRVWDAAGLP